MFIGIEKLQEKNKVEIPLNTIIIDPIIENFLEDLEMYQKVKIESWQEISEFQKLQYILEEERNFILKILLIEKNKDIRELVKSLVEEIGNYDYESDCSYIIRRIQEFRLYYYDYLNDETIIEKVEDTLKTLIKVRKEVIREK